MTTLSQKYEFVVMQLDMQFLSCLEALVSCQAALFVFPLFCRSPPEVSFTEMDGVFFKAFFLSKEFRVLPISECHKYQSK